MQLGGSWNLRVLWSGRVAAVSGEASVSFRPSASGLRAGRRGDSGLRAGGRPGAAIPSGIVVARAGRTGRDSGAEGSFGSCPSGTGSRVALQILVFGWEVPVVLRPCTFRRWPLPFPVSGGGQSGTSQLPHGSCVTVSPAKEAAFAGNFGGQEGNRASGGVPRPDDRRCASAIACADGDPSGFPPVPRRVLSTSCEASPPRGRTNQKPDGEETRPTGPAG